MPKILIQFAHPVLSRSNVQKTLLRYCQQLKGVTINDLYEHYPDLYINVQREQELLVQHDIVVFQHPFYWYSSPAIVKQWMDLVLEYNWAYGARGNVLAGKKMFNAISCGGGKDAYTDGGYNNFPVKQFLLPFQQTATLCKMEYLPPFVVHGSFHITKGAVERYGELYARTLTAFVHGEVMPAQWRGIEYLNDLSLQVSTIENV